MSLTRAIYAFLGVCLTVLIIFAIRTGSFWQAGNWLTTDLWGIVTLADLYLGLAISAAIIVIFERKPTALVWILPLPILGNVWMAVWFVLRLPEIARRIRFTG